MPNIINGNDLYRTSSDLSRIEYDYTYGVLNDLRPGKSAIHKRIIDQVMTRARLSHSVISNRFDSTTFKRLYADLYKDFTKPISSRRFTVSC